MIIQEALKIAKHTGKVEVIPVPTRGDKVVLLRSTEMSEYAFCVLAEPPASSALIQLAFHLPDGKSELFPIVCACCSPETSGTEQSGQAYTPELTQEFKETLAEVCRDHGIRTIFVRKAEKWARRYGSTKGVTWVEALGHVAEMCKNHDREAVEICLRYINYDDSRGLD